MRSVISAREAALAVSELTALGEAPEPALMASEVAAPDPSLNAA